VAQGHIERTGSDPRQPVRVVFDRQARLPLDSQLLKTLDQSPVLVVVAPEADASLLRDAGAEVLVADGIDAALADLGRRGITSLFLEGGRALATAFQVADQLDEARTFVAPVLLGAGPDAPRGAVATAPPRRNALSHAIEPIGDDVLITARFKEW
jgi:diaminohydroxyphosphoribosylaminopyrimidine deaminase/5-amino-6-(5-phosphoribosylamino)uracil reductase